MTKATTAVKRAASSAPQGAAKAKAPKTVKAAAAAAPAEVPPSQAPEQDMEWCRPAFDLLDFLADDLPPTCAVMLRAAAPHALGAGAQARHTFQAAMVDNMTRLSAEALKNHRVAVESAEAAVSALVREKEQSAEQLAAAKSDEEAKREAKATAAANMKSAEEAVAAKKQALEVAGKKMEEVKSLAQIMSDAKAEFEKELGETWAPLKAGSFPPKEWRARQKAIARASGLLAQAGVPESLAAAVPLALKEAVAARTDFVGTVIEHAEMALHEHIASITSQIEEQQASIDSQTQVIVAAEGEAKAAEAELDATMQACIDAENTWVDADAVVRDVTAAIAGFGKKGEQLDAELAASKASLDKLQSLVGGFEGLRDVTEAQPKDAAAEPLKDISAEEPEEKPADSAGQPPAECSAEAAADGLPVEAPEAAAVDA
mmetsp:Transcript_30856/g.77996  ORF Transcript_30856/g.77996 Transcript_30856/m.77996 type:complete len:431 (+) Transcript_30856:114-1406(+)